MLRVQCACPEDRHPSSGVTILGAGAPRLRTHGEPVELSLPAEVGDSVRLWQVDHAGDNFDDGLTAADLAELGAIGNAAIRARAFRVRGTLRRLLAETVDDAIGPEEWRFARSRFGKPYVAPHLPPIQFSISHSAGASLIAMSATSRIGVDCEAARFPDWHEIADGILSPREVARIRRAPADLQEETFLRVWTAKEAYAKLIGVGLSSDLPANGGAIGTDIATWSAEGPSGRTIVSLAVDRSTGGAARPN
jgi:4'-phosphopantetheinyl transferase superfamily protein